MTGKKLSLFNFALGLIALAVLGGAWFIWDRAQAAQTAEGKLLQARAELQAVADTAPAPSREVATEIEADLGRARSVLATMQSELRGHGPAGAALAAVKVPAARTDAYFDLATFVERSRTQARKLGIVIAPGAVHFGFALHSNEGPESALIEAVFRQRLVTQYLVDALFAARPRAILAIKRERPLTATERKARAEALAAAAAAVAADPTAPLSEIVPENNASISPDYFDLDPRLAAPNPELVTVSAFRLVFTGPTAALRSVLNQLATFELPVIVRTVEVEPATGEDLSLAGEESSPAPAASVAASIVLSAAVSSKNAVAAKPAALPPIVAKSISKFTVTVEFVELVPASAASAAAPASAP